MGLPNNLGKLSNMITSTGSSVGIGTTSPNDLLEVSGGFIRLSASAGNGPQFNIYSNGQTNNHVTLAQGFALATDNVGYLYNRANAAFVFGTNNAERMRITSAGNVGIGTSSPSNKLDVRNSGDFDVKFRSEAAGGTVGLLLETANTFSGACQAFIKVIGTVGNGQSNLIFGTAGASGDSTATERMRITSGGNVLIGTTSGSNKFSVSVGGVVSDFYVNSSGGVGSYGFGTGAIYSNAGILTNTNPSDSRLKENIEDIQWGINDILKLRPVKYNWKEDKINQGVQFGFIAQEVQEVMPEAIKEFGEDVKYLGLEKDAIYATLVKAIQELNAKVTALENK